MMRKMMPKATNTAKRTNKTIINALYKLVCASNAE